MVRDMAEKGVVGGAGLATSITLQDVNEVMSMIVALLTAAYLAVSIYKKLKDMKSKDGKSD